MKFFVVAMTTLGFFSSCQTASMKQSVNHPLEIEHSELHCSIKATSNVSSTLSFEVRFSESTPGEVILTLKRTGEPAKVFNAPITASGLIELELRSQDRIGIFLDGKPRITQLTIENSEINSTPCVQLLTNSKGQIATKSASCKATGTPGEGWYHSGRIIQHSHTCSHETISCGSFPIQGWYIQKKINRNLVKAEICTWVKETPKCMTTNGLTGWFLGDRLLARDSNCRTKEIECHGADQNAEGWYAYERSNPQLLVADACSVNRGISYLAR